MIRRIFPHPWLSLVLMLVWLGLVNRWAWGSLVFAAIIGIVLPLMTAPYWPGAHGFSRPGKVPAYLAIALHDIVKANFSVARVVLFTPRRALQPAWITVPLELRRPEAIAALAGTITLTPGTVSCDLAEDGRALLVHCLHAPDPEGVLDEIKTRYEARLKEIFE
ncbi:Na+/H+ antiporter subunit E [Paracoccus sp. (in: a-proteobacteria)]|uniref:Na+/H+ antiporter subunit E n=1 Tax=Paracoccus sp. TaxID=267 RepID=UPI00321FE733